MCHNLMFSVFSFSVDIADERYWTVPKHKLDRIMNFEIIGMNEIYFNDIEESIPCDSIPVS